MQEFLMAIGPYITPGAVKGTLALVAFIGMTVGLIRNKRGGTITLLLAMVGWLLIDVLGKWEAETPLRIAAVGVLTVVTLLLWWFRPLGFVNAALLLAAAAAETVFYLISLVRGMWMLGALRNTLESAYAIACGVVFVWGAVYSLRLAFRRKPNETRKTEPFAPSSPLPSDVTLEEILPEPTTVHSVSEIANENSSALPETLLQTGIGADILRAKRQLDAGEITAEEFKERKAALMGRSI